MFFLNSCGNNDKKNPQKPADSTTSKDPCYQDLIAHLQSHCNRTPDWLARANTSMAIVTILSDGTVIWHEGIWNNGTWEDGTWEDGTWKKWHMEKGYLETGCLER